MRRADATRWRPARGLTAVDVVIACLLVAVLAALAYPSWRAQWQKARRGDGRLALMQLQQAQARWRADHPAYAEATELGAPATSPHQHYHLAVRAVTATGYELVATAQGAQRGDTACAVMQLRQSAGDTHFLSGPDDRADNPDQANRACWNR